MTAPCGACDYSLFVGSDGVARCTYYARADSPPRTATLDSVSGGVANMSAAEAIRYAAGAVAEALPRVGRIQAPAEWPMTRAEKLLRVLGLVEVERTILTAELAGRNAHAPRVSDRPPAVVGVGCQTDISERHMVLVEAREFCQERAGALRLRIGAAASAILAEEPSEAAEPARAAELGAEGTAADPRHQRVLCENAISACGAGSARCNEDYEREANGGRASSAEGEEERLQSHVADQPAASEERDAVGTGEAVGAKCADDSELEASEEGDIISACDEARARRGEGGREQEPEPEEEDRLQRARVDDAADDTDIAFVWGGAAPREVCTRVTAAGEPGGTDFEATAADLDGTPAEAVNRETGIGEATEDCRPESPISACAEAASFGAEPPGIDVQHEAKVSPADSDGTGTGATAKGDPSSVRADDESDTDAVAGSPSAFVTSARADVAEVTPTVSVSASCRQGADTIKSLCDEGDCIQRCENLGIGSPSVPVFAAARRRKLSTGTSSSGNALSRPPEDSLASPQERIDASRQAAVGEVVKAPGKKNMTKNERKLWRRRHSSLTGETAPVEATLVPNMDEAVDARARGFEPGGWFERSVQDWRRRFIRAKLDQAQQLELRHNFFEAEDWDFLEIMFELHLLLHAAGTGGAGSDCPGLTKRNLESYYGKLYKKLPRLDRFGFDTIDDFLAYIPELWVVDGGSGLMRAALAGDAVFDQLVELVNLKGHGRLSGDLEAYCSEGLCILWQIRPGGARSAAVIKEAEAHFERTRAWIDGSPQPALGAIRGRVLWSQRKFDPLLLELAVHAAAGRKPAASSRFLEDLRARLRDDATDWRAADPG